MGHLSRYISLNNLAMALALGSFAPVAAFPAPQAQFQINGNDIAAGIRIGKLLESAKKSFEKGDVKKLISQMLDLKTEAEALTGQKVDLDKSIDAAFNDVKKQGVKVDSKLQKEVKAILKSKGKRWDHKATYMANCMMYDMQYDTADEELLFQHETLQEDAYTFQNHGIMLAAKSAKHDGKKEDGKEVVVPLKLIVGITGALCGFFIVLIPLPIPGKAQVGTFLITTGIKYAADACIECAEENRNKPK